MAAKNLKIRPLDDRVVVEPVEAEERTAGGIVLPDSAKEKPQRGHVVALGPGKLQRPGHHRAVLRFAEKRLGMGKGLGGPEHTSSQTA
jgi:chaperonin GroES